MATKYYSALSFDAFHKASVAYLATDIFNFDIDSISAADIADISAASGNVAISVKDGSTTNIITFTGLTNVAAILKTYFVFADGSQLVVGDGLSTTTDATKTNILLSTDGSDYLFATSSNDSASYANANAAVTVDLSKTTAQDTIGAGSDKLVNVVNVIGSKFNDTLTGDSNGNILDGGAGVDTMDGKDGSDIYIVTTGDVVTDSGASGSDLIKAGVDYTLSASSGIENLTLTGTAVYATGNTGANTITGNVSANILNDGGAGAADTLIGGGGADTYMVNNSGDKITGGVAIDQAISTVDYDLSANGSSAVENLRLVGSAITGTGNTLANTIIGNGNDNFLNGGNGVDTLIDLLGGKDTLTGGLGNDTLKAGKGDDTLIGGVDKTTITVGQIDNLFGGSGNDTYYVTDKSAVVNEAASSIDTNDLVNTTVSYALNDVASAGVDNLTLAGTFLAGSTGLTGTGNKIDNTISVDTTTNSGNNTLIGGKGLDTLTGGDGNDTLIGGVAKLTADLSKDTMAGGKGNDTYYVTDAADVVKEALALNALTHVDDNGTADTVVSTVTYVLDNSASSTSGVEILTLSGTAAINGTGNDLDNTLTGNSGSNTLDGGKGDDAITDILGGNNTLIGGLGNDTLKAGIGNDTLYDSSDATTADTLTGVNSLTGGVGADTYYVTTTSTSVVEKSADVGVDLINTLVSFDMSGAATATSNTTGVEKLTLAGTFAAGDTGLTGTGNDLANTIIVDTTTNNGKNTLIGGTGADLLIGGAGNDILTGGVNDSTADAAANTMTGGAGDDTYNVTNKNDIINEADGNSGGIDTVNSIVSYILSNASGNTGVENLNLVGVSAVNGTGNSLDNIIDGNAQANILIGGLGSDTITGDAGKDTLYDSTGATIADDGTNILDGGAGDDTFYVTTTSTTVNELISDNGVSGEAGDLIYSTVTYTLKTNATNGGVEKLTLTGTAAINGTGNNLDNTLTGNSANNVLKGNAGADILDGKAGVDNMQGGDGNDTYYVDNTSDAVGEANTVNAGDADLVIASVDYTIKDADVENLTLAVGSTAGTGNSSNNIITGNAANNILSGAGGDDTIDGKAGKDTLTGGDGADKFVFSLSTDSSLLNFDVIADFNNDSGLGALDKIDLSALGLTGGFNTTAISSAATTAGDLTLNYFVSGSNTFLVADTTIGSGDNTIDFKIQLTGFTGTLTSADFTL